MDALPGDAELQAFAAQWVQRLQEEARTLREFADGPVFERMRQSLLARGAEAGFGDEDLAYFRAQTLARGRARWRRTTSARSATCLS